MSRTDEQDPEAESDVPTFLRGGGACAALIARHDWRATSLGPLETWPASLRATVANMMRTRQPMLLFWGPELIQLYNDAFVPSFGRGKHPKALGQPAEECWAEAWPVVGAQIEAVMTHGEPAWHEDTLVPIYRNGRMEEVFWTYSYSPAHDDDGRVHGTLVIVTEMTGRVLSTRRLESLSTLSTKLARASSTAACLDALETVARACPEDVPFVVVGQRRDGAFEVERATGLDDVSAGRVAARLDADAQPCERCALSLGFSVPASPWPEEVSRVFAVRFPTGSGERWLAFGLSPRLPFDDAYESYLAQLTEQLAAAQGRLDEAQASNAIESQRDSLLMQAPVATALVAGPQHVYQLANPLYVEMVGFDPVGMAYLEAFPEVADTPLPGILDRVYQTGEPFSVNEMQVSLRQRSDELFVNFHLEPLRRPGGDVYGMMAVVLDITPQVRARQALEKIDAEREKHVAALQEASSAKDAFLAMLGHELRNPLAPIVSAVELMKLQDPEPNRERDTIERHVRRVVRLVDDLLDIARITRGKVSLDLEHTSLTEVVAAAVEHTGPLFRRRAHRLEVDVAPDATVVADEGRLVQVAANLLTNAAHYTPEGGEVRVIGKAEGERVVLEVADTGQGIAPEQLPHVFEPFTQGPRGRDRAEGGLGIGLALVQGLVELHGGTVSAHSDGDGRGSRFVVSLPRDFRTPGRQSQPPTPPPRSKAASGVRVLIVDDNEDAGSLLGLVVERHGYVTAVATHPRDAIALAAEFQPEVAVLDIGLPEMDGYELAAKLREIVPGCRFIALTGYGQRNDHARSESAGFEAHLVKPVKTRLLLETLRG